MLRASPWHSFIVLIMIISVADCLLVSSSSTFIGTSLQRIPYPTLLLNNNNNNNSNRNNNPSMMVLRRCITTMGLQIKIRMVGRKNGSEGWLDDAYRMYETRLSSSSSVAVETIWHKTNAELIQGVTLDRTKGHSMVVLDSKGATMTSEIFATNMYQWLDQGGSRLVFVIGGADGLPSELLTPNSAAKKEQLLSLSSLTFTHQFARTLLMEQIYRATEIRKGSGYHK